MAHSTLHAAVGMAAGMAMGLPALRSAWKAGAHLTRPVGHMIVLGAACALWALMPSLLHFAGAPEPVCRGAWMHIFFLHPLVASLHRWTGFTGPLLLAALLAAQYLVLLAAIRRAESRRSRL